MRIRCLHYGHILDDGSGTVASNFVASCGIVPIVRGFVHRGHLYGVFEGDEHDVYRYVILKKKN